MFGEGLCGGYDVACKFSATIRRVPLGELAQKMGFCCVVRLFHGHSHNRLCQLHCLPTYITETGLEDFENCEPYFSCSNALAGVKRGCVLLVEQEVVGRACE